MEFSSPPLTYFQVNGKPHIPHNLSIPNYPAFSTTASNRFKPTQIHSLSISIRSLNPFYIYLKKRTQECTSINICRCGNPGIVGMSCPSPFQNGGCQLQGGGQYRIVSLFVTKLCYLLICLCNALFVKGQFWHGGISCRTCFQVSVEKNLR